MMHQWTVLCFILATCGAQQHLTCLRTDEIIALLPQTTDGNVQQGRPGRRGPIGPVGLQGLKGEPGILDNSIIDELKGKKIVYSASSVSVVSVSGRWCQRGTTTFKPLWHIVYAIN